MRITSYNKAAGKKAKEKVHAVDGPFGVGRHHDGMTFQRLPGVVLTLSMDGRTYLIEMDEGQAAELVDRLQRQMEL
jgi:hypothetical protein